MRVQDDEPALSEDGGVTLAGYRIPSAVPNTLTLNFRGWRQTACPGARPSRFDRR
jgi:hypothetical protein